MGIEAHRRYDEYYFCYYELDKVGAVKNLCLLVQNNKYISNISSHFLLSFLLLIFLINLQKLNYFLVVSTTSV